MKSCLNCNEHFDSTLAECPFCRKSPPEVNGFSAYAPELASNNSGFKDQYFNDLIQNEENNFWFTTRNNLILWALEKYCPEFHSFLEVGCGNGRITSLLVGKPQKLIGIDPDAEKIKEARKKQNKRLN